MSSITNKPRQNLKSDFWVILQTLVLIVLVGAPLTILTNRTEGTLLQLGLIFANTLVQTGFIFRMYRQLRYEFRYAVKSSGLVFGYLSISLLLQWAGRENRISEELGAPLWIIAFLLMVFTVVPDLFPRSET